VKQRKLALFVFSLILVLAFSACNLPGTGGATPTAAGAVPIEAGALAGQAVTPTPTYIVGAEPVLIAAELAAGFEITPFCHRDPTWVGAILHYHPTDHRMHSARLDGTPVTCDALPTPGHYMCRDIRGTPGSEATFSFFLDDGTLLSGPFYVPDCEGGGEAVAAQTILIPADLEVRFDITPFCHRDPTWVGAILHYYPTDHRMRAARVDETPVACQAYPTPGHYLCRDLPGTPDSEATFSFFLDDGSLYSGPFYIPDCGGGGEAIGAETVLIPAELEVAFFDITPVCYRGATTWLGAIIHYRPTDQRMASAELDGTALTCEAEPPPGYYLCPNIHGTPGSEATLTFCLEDGTCHSGPFYIGDCGGGEETPPAAWRIVSTGCHDEERIYFILDTGLDWLVPGADFTYTADDGVTHYSCSVHPTIPGRLYCSGTRPGGPGQLQVCVVQGSLPPNCNYFSDWPSTVRGIESCAPTLPPPAVNPCMGLIPAACSKDSRCYVDQWGVCQLKP
jgi:hypothetical protein